jgi:hypothetical protein
MSSTVASKSLVPAHSRWIAETSGYLYSATGTSGQQFFAQGAVLVDMGKTVYVTRAVDRSSSILRKVKRMTPQAEGSYDYATGYICIGGDNAAIATSPVSRLY